MSTTRKSETEEFQVAGTLRRPMIGDSLYEFIEHYEIAILLFLLIFVVALAVLGSRYKALWYDEIFTSIVATQPSWHRFFASLPAEGNPPLNTLCTRLFVTIFGVSDLSIRLSALLGFVGALVGVYVFVRRECGRVFGILAVALVMFNPVWDYSFEARPYGAMLGFLMLALVSWQSATRAGDASPKQARGLALLGLVAGILGCAFSHYIGLLEVAVPLLAGEVARSFARRRIDWPLAATGLCAIPAAAIIIPMMHRTRDVVISNSLVLVPPLTLSKIHAYFVWSAVSWPEVMDSRLVLLVVFVAIITWAPGRGLKWSRVPVSPVRPISTEMQPRGYVMWACLGASLLIPITWLAMIAAKGWYFCRYGIGSALGIVLFFCLILAKRQLRSRAAIAGLIAVSLAVCAMRFRREIRARPERNVIGDLIYNNPSELPVVITEPIRFPTVWWYAPKNMRSRIICLMGNRDLVEAVISAEIPFTEYTTETPSILTRNNDHFLVEVEDVDLNQALDPRKELAREGFTVTMAKRGNQVTLYDVIRTSKHPS